MGMPGFPGINGMPGIQGPPGMNGKDGLDGCNGTDVSRVHCKVHVLYCIVDYSLLVRAINIFFFSRSNTLVLFLVSLNKKIIYITGNCK